MVQTRVLTLTFRGGQCGGAGTLGGDHDPPLLRPPRHLCRHSCLGRSGIRTSLLRSQPRPDLLRHPGLLLYHHRPLPGQHRHHSNGLNISSLCQVEVLFHLLGYSGMFLMAGATALSGLLVTVFMGADIQYERERKQAGAKLDTK